MPLCAASDLGLNSLLRPVCFRIRRVSMVIFVKPTHFRNHPESVPVIFGALLLLCIGILYKETMSVLVPHICLPY